MTTYFINIPTFVMVTVVAEAEDDITEEMVETAVLDQHGKYVNLSVKDCVAIEEFYISGNDD